MSNTDKHIYCSENWSFRSRFILTLYKGEYCLDENELDNEIYFLQGGYQLYMEQNQLKNVPVI